MRLDAWLRQNRSLGERLRVVECLCQAVNAVHDRGHALAALEPSKVELGADGQCDLAAAQKGTPSREYLAPDRGESGQPSSIADVYAAGAIAWEVLVGRSPGSSPSHLAEVRPDVPREVADAVMACLERSPDWRPKDLTYLAQISAAKQPASGRGGSPSRAPRTARTSRTARVDAGRPARRTWPLLVALVVVLALAAAAGWQYLGPGGTGLPTLTGRSSRPAPPTPTATPPLPATSATPNPVTESSPAPTPTPTATPMPAPDAGANAVVARPTPTAPPLPATPPAGSLPTPPVSAPPAGPEETLSPAPPAPVGALPEPEPPEAAAPAPARPPSPAELTAVSPLKVSRPGKVLLDVRGTSLRTGHRVEIVALRRAPSGISVVRQKLVSDTLITVLLDLTPDVAPGEYGIAVEEPQGLRSNTLIFTVEK